MFSKILIANRGEIACRVIMTARRLGIETVAVHSNADSHSRHVSLATEAIQIGASPAAESYLVADRIIEAALKCRAQAIHPGYGFLSENPDFVESVESAGLVFIGPTAASVRAMGLKDAAKSLMEKSGVPVVPGYHGGNQDPVHLARMAEKIGFPVMIKARAGGGGKGMRLVQEREGLEDAIASAQREGSAGFGDHAVLLEKCIECPRHVEFQIVGDKLGYCVHLFERDCSMQRRHQKIIEEAPAPGMTADVRAAMGAAAIKAARAVNYVGVGTVEFIADSSAGLRKDRFWFMEMNTRLQVEHPVTEAVTGLDLVELQLRIAAGESLPFRQSDLAVNGHALEARVYAEDVAKGFLPVTGQLRHLEFPDGRQFERGPVRIDSGARPGDEISTHYDPMIAKIVVHGSDRPTALNMLATALSESKIAGLKTNLEFLARLVSHVDFRNGEVDTGLIGRNLDLLACIEPVPIRIVAVAALSALELISEPNRQDDPWTGLAGWRHWPTEKLNVALEYLGDRFEIVVSRIVEDRFCVSCESESVEISARSDDENSVTISVDGSTRTLGLVRTEQDIYVFDGGRTFVFSFPDLPDDIGAEDTSGSLVLAPIPGQLKLIYVKAGQDVSLGDMLLVLETMKMEHSINATLDGRIAAVFVAVGDQVEEGMPLVELEPKNGGFS